MLVFFLKTHLHPMGFIYSSGSTKVHTWFSYMESISYFMTTSHLSDSKLFKYYFFCYRLIILYEQYVLIIAYEKSISLRNSAYPTRPMKRLCFRRINCYFISMNNNLRFKKLIYVYLSTMNFFKFNFAPTIS